jgi:hypothetical protein
MLGLLIVSLDRSICGQAGKVAMLAAVAKKFRRVILVFNRFSPIPNNIQLPFYMPPAVD